MSNSEIITGNSIIDELQGMQIIANKYQDVDTKIKRMRQVMQFIGARELLEKACMVSASAALGKSLDEISHDGRTLFTSGLMFTGTLVQFDYIYAPNVPLDSLTCDFSDVSVLQAETEAEKSSFNRLSLQVPILSIDLLLCGEAL